MATSLESLISSLSIGTPSDLDHQKVLQNATTSSSPSARGARIVALLNLEKYSEVADLLETESSQGLELEFAYALYKFGRHDQARRLLVEAGTGSTEVQTLRMRGMVHLLAQLYYREESFASAAKTYTHLLKSPHSGETEVAVNIDAVLAQNALKTGDSISASQLVRSIRPEYSSFETLFNQACRAIAKGELMQASILLKKSKDACEALDDLSYEEKKSELQPILIQQVYVAILMKRSQEAATFASFVSNDNISDPVTRQIASTNKALASTLKDTEEVNPYLLQRQIMEIPNLKKDVKPFSFQTNTIYFNSHALKLMTNKHEGLRKSTDAIASATGGASLDTTVNVAAVANAAVRLHGLSGLSEIKALGRLVSSAPLSRVVGYTFTYVQLLAKAGRFVQATSQMDILAKQLLSAKSISALTVLSSPGFLGLWLALKGQKKALSHTYLPVIRPVARFWLDGTCDGSTESISAEKLSGIWDNTSPSLLYLVGSYLLQSWHKEDVILSNRLFELLSSLTPQDRLAQVGQVSARAALTPISLSKQTASQSTGSSSPESVSSESGFRSLDSFLQNVDVDDLERIGIPSSSSFPVNSNSTRVARPSDLISSFTHLVINDSLKQSIAANQASNSAVAVMTGSKRTQAQATANTSTLSSSSPQKRVRLSRQGKNVIPGQTLDPERWLPMRERSYFKPKGGKGKNQRGGGAMTQGGVVDESLAAVISSTPAAVNPSSTPIPGGRAAAKKGKKGRR